VPTCLEAHKYLLITSFMNCKSGEISRTVSRKFEESSRLVQKFSHQLISRYNRGLPQYRLLSDLDDDL
jgi:hypothetical protein